MRLRGNFYFRGCYSKPPQAEKKIHKKRFKVRLRGNFTKEIPLNFVRKKINSEIRPQKHPRGESF